MSLFSGSKIRSKVWMPKIKQAKPIIQMNVADMAILAFQGRFMHVFFKNKSQPEGLESRSYENTRLHYYRDAFA